MQNDKTELISESIDSLKDSSKNYADILIYNHLIKAAYGFDYIDKEEIDIDFMLCSNTVYYVSNLINQLNTYYDNNNNGSAINHPDTCFAWCILSGIGISYFYHKNNEHNRENLINSVLEPRGLFELDEFVLEEIIEANGMIQDEIKNQIMTISDLAMLAMEGHSETSDSAFQQFYYICRACFLFGTSYEKCLIEDN